MTTVCNLRARCPASGKPNLEESVTAFESVEKRVPLTHWTRWWYHAGLAVARKIQRMTKFCSALSSRRLG